MSKFMLAVMAGLFVSKAALGADAEGDAAYREGNYAKALEFWQRDAAAGDGAADLQIGLLYDTGRGAPRDPQRAAEWYRRGADAGNGTAAFNLAVLEDLGRAGPRKADEAVRWYRVAAENGVGRGALALGMMAEAGDGMPKNFDAAAKWYRQAQASGIAIAGDKLANVLARQARGMVQRRPAPPSDDGRLVFERAVELWRAKGIDGAGASALSALQGAAEHGYPMAEYDLAYAYEHGIGVTADLPSAYTWYQRAELSLAVPTLRSAAAANRRRIGSRLNEEGVKPADVVTGQATGSRTDADH